MILRRSRQAVPPELIEFPGHVLRRMTVLDAPAVSEAATESLDHLEPWMPWATAEGVSPEAQRLRMSGPAWEWAADGDYSFGAFLPDGRLVAAFGLHRRIGPGALEMGYWVHAAHVGRGIATAGARALTDAGLAMAGIRRMEIHCDVANVASAAVPARLGYTMVGSEDHVPEAPGEEGRRLIWVMYEREWKA
ncbi:MAG: GNAT family N-acetyltransferase, partial [Acidimicrobiales bacterium]